MLRVLEDERQQVQVLGLEEVYVSAAEEVMKWIQMGSASRYLNVFAGTNLFSDCSVASLTLIWLPSLSFPPQDLRPDLRQREFVSLARHPPNRAASQQPGQDAAWKIFIGGFGWQWAWNGCEQQWPEHFKWNSWDQPQPAGSQGMNEWRQRKPVCGLASLVL